MKNIVIFGAPGSGKGTQSDLLIKKYGFGHISTGDVLRGEIKKGTELGKTAKGYIDNGQLIPDELMVSILASVYDGFGHDHEGVIFDGFPRTIPQAEALKAMLAERGHGVAAMIELEVPEDELTRRRVAFYERQGFRICDKDYVQPPYRTGGASLPLYLMVAGDASAELPALEDVRKGIYREVYRVDC